MAPPVCPAYAHEESLCFVITPFIELTGRSYCCVLFATHRGAVFFVWIRYRSYSSYVRRKRRRWKIHDYLKQDLGSIDKKNKPQLSSMQMIRIV